LILRRVFKYCFMSLNAFILSPTKWVATTNAKGIIVRSGRYGGTYAHKDIAFKFANWISVEFELYFIKEFQRLKEEEQKQLVDFKNSNTFGVKPAGNYTKPDTVSIIFLQTHFYDNISSTSLAASPT